MERDQEIGTRSHERRGRKSGRPKNRWKIRVVRIDPRKYPQFIRDSGHPFALMAAEARIDEIDSFCARLRARRNKPTHDRSAAA